MPGGGAGGVVGGVVCAGSLGGGVGAGVGGAGVPGGGGGGVVDGVSSNQLRRLGVWPVDCVGTVASPVDVLGVVVLSAGVVEVLVDVAAAAGSVGVPLPMTSVTAAGHFCVAVFFFVEGAATLVVLVTTGT